MDGMSGVEEWAELHAWCGHHPHPAPTDENPERRDCVSLLQAMFVGDVGP